MALSNLTRNSATAARNLQTGPNDIGGMTVKDLLDAKGKRTIACVQVAREEEAILRIPFQWDGKNSRSIGDQGLGSFDRAVQQRFI